LRKFDVWLALPSVNQGLFDGRLADLAWVSPWFRHQPKSTEAGCHLLGSDRPAPATRLESNPFGFQGTPTWRNATEFRCKATGLGCSGTKTWRKGIGLRCKGIGLRCKGTGFGCSGPQTWRKGIGLGCKGTGFGCSGTETWRKATIAGFKRTLMCFFVQHKRFLWSVPCDRQQLWECTEPT